MDNPNESPSIKLIATCVQCGAPVGSAGDSSQASRKQSLCPRCAQTARVDEEDDDDDDGPPGVIKIPSSDSASAKAEAEAAGTPVSDPDVAEHYRILRVFADCQHGKAFLVNDKNLDTDFVLRFVTAGVARMTGGLPIETVAQLLVQQNHPHLATVYDWQSHGKSNCIVLDAPPDRNVETIIRNEGFLDLPRAIEIFIQVCEGLEELHKVGIVHGFVRPGSIGIVESASKIDSAKVTNFSITNVSVNNTDQPLKISRNYTCNDVFYMSPEELRGEPPSVTADIYSLGCVMFHAITGKPVYRARTVQEVKDHHLDATPARFRRRYEIPANVELVVLRMLETDPLKRYKSARSIRRDLERLRDNKTPLLEDRWRTILSYFGA